MPPRKYPPLKLAHVREILTRAGFTLRNTEGSHERWEHENYKGAPRHVSLDCAYEEFDGTLIHSMMNQAGMTREEFYGQTRATAKKINLRWRRKA